MIKDIRSGFDCDGIYLIKDAYCINAQNGSNYIVMTLQDSSGTIDGKMFNVGPKEIEVFKGGNVVKVEASASTYKDKLQVVINDGELIDSNKVDVSSLIPSSPIPLPDLLKEMNQFIDSLKDEDIKNIVRTTIDDNYQKYIDNPAAVRNHHDFYHGLLFHSLSMCRVASALANLYPDVDYDLLVGACLLHDIGKTKELSGPILTKYTLEGDLLGHLTIGAEMVEETCKKLNIQGEKPLLLKHMILSHHGKLEFGACVLPQTKEAYMLSVIDDLDAKLMSIDKAMKNVKKGEFSDKIFAMDNRMFYKPSK